MSPASKKEVDGFAKKSIKEAEQLVSSFFPQMIAKMDNLLQASLGSEDLSALRAPLDIPIPDPAKEELKKKKKSEVSMWVQLQIPRIEDGNNFGVAVQEKVFELLTNTRTKIEGFQTQITKYYTERGDAVAKASKQPHVGDYRQLVHELDEHQYRELRIVVLEIRNTYVSSASIFVEVLYIKLFLVY
uniref:Proteasome activator complex subunit 1 n=1 Tax=Astyanax mexicanus TaxID=7994 RepID=A0A8B9J4Q9_ASTMX